MRELSHLIITTPPRENSFDLCDAEEVSDFLSTLSLQELPFSKSCICLWKIHHQHNKYQQYNYFDCSCWQSFGPV